MAESLQFSIGADTKSFNDGIAGMMAGLAGLVAAFISAQKIVEAFSAAIDMGGRLHDLSTRTGETAGNLAVLERAFDNTSVGAEKLGPAIAKMQKNMVDMQQGSKEAASAFEQLGLSWADLEGKSPAEQMQLIGERLAAIHNDALRTETAMRIFGRSGAELIPILVNFSAETEEAKRQLGSLPEQLDKTAFQVDALGDNLSSIGNKLTELAYGFLSEVIPALEAFTGKLSGVDAASVGAGLADALVGAFADPMKAASILGETLSLGAKHMGNELVFQIQYWGELMFNTFSAIGTKTIPMLGNNMLGALQIAAGGFGLALAEAAQTFWGTVAPMMESLGLGGLVEEATVRLNELNRDSNDLMVEGAAKIAESANTFQGAFAEAQKNSTVVKQDLFGAEGSSQKIADDFASLQKSARDAVDELTFPEPSSIALASGRTMTESEKDPLVSILENENLVKQTAQEDEEKKKAQTAAQIQAELNRRLSLIAGASSTQIIGQSASASRAIEDQKKLEQMIALGKGDTAEAKTLQNSIQRHIDQAAGISLTSADQFAASSWAWSEYLKEGQTQSLDELTKLAQENILEGKRAEDQLTKAEQAEKAKAEAAGAGGKGAGAPPVSLSSIVNSIQIILQKIEPKIPTHVMS